MPPPPPQEPTPMTHRASKKLAKVLLRRVVRITRKNPGKTTANASGHRTGGGCVADADVAGPIVSVTVVLPLPEEAGTTDGLALHVPYDAPLATHCT